MAKAVAHSAYLSHHSGAGGTSSRVLHGILLNHVQGSVIYDIDNLGTLGLLVDAVRVSLNVLMVFGSESLCRPWCISAIVCAHRKGTPLHTLIFTNPKPEETVCSGAGGGGEYVKTFTGKVADKSREAAFEVDTFTLRGYGLSQNDVHPAIQALTAVEPVFTNFLDEAKLNNDLDELFGRMGSIKFKGSVGNSIEPIFRGSKRCSQFKEGGALSQGKVAGSNLSLILCDHLDGEAVAVSRLLQLIFSVNGNWLEDQDLSPTDYATVVKNGKPVNAVFAFTQNSHKSTSQLARLGLLIACQPEMHMVPVAVGISFDFPDEDFLQQLELGKALNLGPNPAAVLASIAGAEVTLRQIANGLGHVMSFLVSFVNPATLPQRSLEKVLLDILARATGSGRRSSGSKVIPANAAEPAATGS
jgi:hypothetical protein